MSNIDASGDFYYINNTGNSNDYFSVPDGEVIYVDNTDGNITVAQNPSEFSTDFMFMYKGEWVKLTDMVDKLERIEKFISAFVETFDGYGITIGRINKMREIWKSEKLNFEEAHKDYHNDYINDGDLKIDI